MPLFREARSRRGWRREVAEYLVERIDAEGELQFVGYTPEDRREMLKIAELLPDDILAELFEDPYYPGLTFMELSLLPEPIRYDVPLRVIRPDTLGRQVG